MSNVLPAWFLVLGVFLSLVTVAGNGTVIYLIATTRRLHNPTNWIIVSLAVADACVGATYVLISYLHQEISFEFELRYSIISFLFAASCINLCLLTIDRYIFVSKPLRYVTIMSTRRALFMICFAWVAAFVPHASFYFICTVWTSPEKSPNCERNFSIFDFIVSELLPAVILLPLTVYIFYIARKRSRQTELQMAQLRFNQTNAAADQDKEAREASTRKETKSTIKIIGTAVATFIICFLVQLMYTVLYQFTGKSDDDWNFLLCSGLLYLLNSAINPIAYALFKNDIKGSLRKMFISPRWRIYYYLAFAEGGPSLKMQTVFYLFIFLGGGWDGNWLDLFTWPFKDI